MVITERKHTDIIFVLLVVYGVTTALSIVATNIILGLLIVIALIKCVSERKFFYTLEGTPVLFLFFWRAARVCFYPSNWFKYGGKFWSHLPYFVVSQLKVKKIKIIIYVTLAMAALTAVVGIVQFFGGFNCPFLRHQLVKDNTLVGFNFINRLHSGGYYAIMTVVSFVLFCYLRESKKTKVFLFVFSLLNFIAVLLTFARTYYIATLVTLFIILLKKKVKWLLCGLVLLSAMFFAPFEISRAVRSRVASIIDTKQNSSNVERLWMWKTALRVIKEHPFIGIGYKNWQNEVEVYFEKEKGQEPLLSIITRARKGGVDEGAILGALKAHPHNAYLNVAVEDGLIGFVLFILFWAGNFVAAFYRARRAEVGTILYALNIAVGYAIVMLMFGSFFENNLTTSRLLLPITFLMGLSYTNGRV